MAKTKPAQTMSADKIIEALAAKHADDVFVRECKDGPSQNANTHLRMDAWVMNKSWSNPRTVAYEVKVSRADFLKDQKWHGYLPYCNEFYFVCPHGLIQLEEVSADAGLMYVTQEGRVLTKKKAPYRSLEVPESVYRYILMCRVKITRHWYDGGDQDKSLYWKQWLEKSREEQEIGHAVGARLQENFRLKVLDVERKQQELERQIQQYADVRQFLVSIGMSPDSAYLWHVKKKLEEVRRVVPPELEHSLTNVSRWVAEAQGRLAELKAGAAKELDAAREADACPV